MTNKPTNKRLSVFRTDHLSHASLCESANSSCFAQLRSAGEERLTVCLNMLVLFALGRDNFQSVEFSSCARCDRGAHSDCGNCIFFKVDRKSLLLLMQNFVEKSRKMLFDIYVAVSRLSYYFWSSCILAASLCWWTQNRMCWSLYSAPFNEVTACNGHSLPQFSSSILTRYLIWHLPFMCSLRQRQERVEKDQRRTKSRGKEPPIFSVDLLNCHDFMWLKWKRELGSVYSTINLSFKPKDLATLKL